MKKIALGVMLVAVPLLSGCALPTLGGVSSGGGPAVSFVRSSDGGTTFESKTTLDAKTTFASAEVISMAMSAQDTRRIFLGTKESGMFASDNSGDSWRKIKYPPTRIYGLVVDGSNAQRLFATGEFQGRGKIYQSTDAGENWNEVYTEPANGTVIVSLVQDPFNSQVLYAGTSVGMVIRTNDGGATWKNVALSSSMGGHIIRSIIFDPKKESSIYFLVDGKGVYVSDGEKTITEPGVTVSAAQVALSTTTADSSGAVSMAIDPSRSGVVYVGSVKGMARSTDFGKTWESIDIIGSANAKKPPINAIAINPKNSDEISYIAALTLYKSTDGGVHWSTHQISSDKSASLLRYDPYDASVMYIGFKN
jgi:photosystem II stability/assembly factor-like uncharacterized protein